MKTKIASLALAFCTIALSAQTKIPMPKPGPAPVVNLGQSHEFKLANGLTVIVVENHKLPRVSSTLSIDNKPFALGAKKGADGLLSDMMGTGTTTLSKDAFNQKIEQLGARVSYNSEGGYASSLTKYFDEIFGYFAQGATTPKFNEEEFKAVKARYIEGLKSNEKSVESAAYRMTNVLTYGAAHPFAEFDTPERIQAISLADVESYYQTYYKPNNAYLIFVGDITAKKARELAEKGFGNWKQGALNIADVPKVQEFTKTQIDVVNMPNAVQSVVGVSYPVYLTKKDPDYYAVQVASTILGGDFNSKLNMNLREAHGWTYGARGGVRDSRYVGTFSTNATVRNNVTDSAVVETIKEMRNMTLEKVGEEELNNVKAKFLGNFVLSLERPETIANQALVTKTNGLSDSFYKDYLKNINKVTAEDVLRVSKKYFRPDQAKIIVTGKAEEISPALAKLGYPINFYDQYGNKIADPATTKKTTTTTVAEIKNAYLEAVGGKAAVAKVKTSHLTGEISMMGMKGNFSSKTMTPDLVSNTISLMGTEIKTVYDGTKGYMAQGANKMELPADQLTTMKGVNSIFPVLSEGFDNAKVDGIHSVEGSEAYKVVYPSGKKVEYYDTKTGLLSRSEVTTSTPQGDMLTTTNYKDFKTFSGLKFATIQETTAGPQAFTIKINNIEINKNVTKADFQ